MKDIYLLTDYKNHYGSKHDANPYRSGFNKELLTEYFFKEGYNCVFLRFSEINFKENWRDKLILYTSQEDLYKNFIEDIILGLELAGANVIPAFKFLKAHNNKVFMEILRDSSKLQELQSIHSKYYGSLEDLLNDLYQISFPTVIKSASGAMSKGVGLACNPSELVKFVKSISRTRDIKKEIRDIVRKFRHKGYKLDSKYRKKFITQNFISGLQNDWKVLVFGNIYYVFKRNVRKNDFRASGSGHSTYDYGTNCDFPTGMLHYVKNIFDHFKVPQLSIDICFSDGKFHAIELQFIYFGTVGHEKSDIYYKYNEETNSFIIANNELSLEEVYTKSIIYHINNIN